MLIMQILTSIISHFFRLTLIFSLFFIWIRYYEKNLLFCLLLTSTFTLITDLIISFILRKKDSKQNLLTKEKKLAENYANLFIFSNKQKILSFFFNMFSKEYSCEKKSNYIYFKKNENKIAIFPLYKYENISIENIISAYKEVIKTGCNKLIICTNTYDKNTQTFVKSLPIKTIIFNKYEVFEKLMKNFDFFPKENFSSEVKKQTTFSFLLSYALNKKRCKGYVFSSLILLISSFFVKVSIYYIIISSLLIVLAIISFLNTTYNSSSSDIF